MSNIGDLLERSGESLTFSSLVQGPVDSITGVPAPMFSDHVFKGIFNNLATREDTLDGVRESISSQVMTYFDLGYVDFTTFTEAGTATMLSQTAKRSTFTDMENQDDGRLYYDYGGPFFYKHTHVFKFLVSAFDNPSSSTEFPVIPVCYTNRQNDYWALRGTGNPTLALGFGIADGVATYSLDIEEITDIDTRDTNTVVAALTVGTLYYMKIVRDGTSIEVYVYDNADMDSLVGSYTGTLNNDQWYRYLFMPQGYGLNRAFGMTGYIEYLQLADEVKRLDRFTWGSQVWEVESDPEVFNLADRFHHGDAPLVRIE